MAVEGFQWGPFLLFALVSCLTPGPNVILLTGSGTSWGYRRTIPHLLGVCLGFPVMFVLVQFGFDHVFARFPWLFAGLTVGSLIYVAWLAIKVFRLGLVEDEQVSRRPRPMTFVEAVLFQWINGKAWQIVLMAATLYATPKTSVRLWSGLIFIIFLIITGSFWVELGAHISGLLKNPKTRFAYYSALALALIISTFPSGISMLRTLAH